ncbi:SOS response-associated peptidase [Rhodococcus hoagii]|nr:SOS response-associated peptidase [Prescottella equi]
MCGRYASTTTDRNCARCSMWPSRWAPKCRRRTTSPPPDRFASCSNARPAGSREQGRAAAQDRQVGSGTGVVEGPKIGSRLINARSETITEKPSFRSAAAKRRCIIPADGYFEWMKDAEGKKIPYFLHGDDPVLAMAGLYELWPDPSKAEDDPDRWLWTTTVLTTQATDATGHIHDRSPVILPASFWEHWLDPSITDRDEVQAMVNSIPEPHLQPYQVSTAVNNVENDRPELLNPVGEDEK